MKKTLLLLFISLTWQLIFGQVPQKINYQAVARDASGNPLANAFISLRISILNTSSSGTEVYKETFLVNTNEIGHFNLAIGSGSVVLGNFSTIDWEKDDKYIKIEMDAKGGTNYSTMGATQLLSVPYALNAKTATSLSPNVKFNMDQINGSGATLGQVISWNGTKWVPLTVNTSGNDNWGSQTVQTNATLTGSGTNTSKLGLAQQGATNGQVLKWNGNTWAPANETGSDNWGTQTVQSSAVLSGSGTTASPLTISQQGATNGQVLKWNGTTWMPANETGSDNWGTQTASTNATLSGNGTAASPLGIAPQGATNGQVLKWDGTAWIPKNDSLGSDNWGTQTTSTNATLFGNGTASKPLGIAQQGATVGQVLKWDGTGWIPKNDSLGSDNWGTQTASTNATLTGNGTATTPLGLSQQGATSGQVLAWNGTSWSPTTLSSGTGAGDNWGSQVTQTDATLAGSGTAGSPLKLSQQGATNGQLLQWNGTTWSPVTLSGDNWGTQTAQTNGAISGNGTATSPIILAQQGATNGQILKWNGTAWIPKNDSLGSDNWGTQTASTNATLSGNGTAASPLALAQQGATNGQILKWNGTAWIPKNDSLGSDNWGTQTASTNATLSGNGTTASPLALAQQGATTGQVLKWSGTAWIPKNDSIGSGGGSYTASNGLTLTGSNFSLGGSLSTATTMTTTSTNTFALAGLITGTASDSILTQDPSNNVIRRVAPDKLNYWSKDIFNNLSYKTGKVSIGTDTPKANLYVYDFSPVNDTSVLIRTNNNSGGSVSMYIKNTSNAISSGVGINAEAGYIGIRGASIATANTASGIHVGLVGVGNNNSLGTTYGVYGTADSAGFSAGVRALGSHAGVLSNVDVTNNRNIILGFGFADTSKTSIIGYNGGANLINNISSIGSTGVSSVSNTWANIGVNGLAKSPSSGGSPMSIGVLGEAQGGNSFQIGILGWVDSVVSGSSVYAGYFAGATRSTGKLTVDDTIRGNKGLVISGGKSVFSDSVRINSNLYVNGTLSKAAGTFRIDHPADPENKYLIHSFVESPDMMNIYNGNITTDKDGYARVHLPDYFTLLNKDFRYQLTVLGSFAQAIIKEKVDNNQFLIQTDKPNIEVSWQITGIRKDPYAETYRIKDVEEKAAADKGTYLHPELYGKNETLKTGYIAPEKKSFLNIQKTEHIGGNTLYKITDKIKAEESGVIK